AVAISYDHNLVPVYRNPIDWIPVQPDCGDGAQVLQFAAGQNAVGGDRVGGSVRSVQVECVHGQTDSVQITAVARTRRESSRLFQRIDVDPGHVIADRVRHIHAITVRTMNNVDTWGSEETASQALTTCGNCLRREQPAPGGDCIKSRRVGGVVVICDHVTSLGECTDSAQRRKRNHYGCCYQSRGSVHYFSLLVLIVVIVGCSGALSFTAKV